MSSVSRSVGRPVSRSVLAGQLNNLASIIKSLFASNEQGFAYDPNDLTTLYQDAVGTVPVTAVGQPVGLIRDKSGRNNHAYQTTSASRPILRKNAVTGANYLEFDGVDDYLQALASLPAPVTVMCPSFMNSISFKVLFSAGLAGYLRSTKVHASAQSSTTTISTGRNEVDTVVHELSGNSVAIRTNASKIAVSDGVGSVELDAYNTPNKYIGAFSPINTSLLADMHLYGFVAVGKILSETEEASLRKVFNARMGI